MNQSISFKSKNVSNLKKSFPTIRHISILPRVNHHSNHLQRTCEYDEMISLQKLQQPQHVMCYLECGFMTAFLESSKYCSKYIFGYQFKSYNIKTHSIFVRTMKRCMHKLVTTMQTCIIFLLRQFKKFWFNFLVNWGVGVWIVAWMVKT